MAGSQPAEQKEKTFEIVQQPKQVAETLPSELYIPEYDITVKTDYSDPFVVRYLAGRRGMNIPRENWFGMENLGESREKIANGIINQTARGGAAAVAGGAMALYRAGKGLASSAIDMGKRDWELFRLEQEQTGELVRLQQLRTEGKISESDYMREKGRLEDRFVIKSKAVHDKFLEADRISAEQIKKLKESNEAWLKSTGLAKTGRDGFVYDLAGGMASLAGSIALAALFKSPAAAGVAFGAITGREDYEEALENGKSRETAAYLGFWTGAASMFLEKYGVETIMRPLKNAGIIKYAVRSVITEGSEELTQNLADDGIMTMWGGREKEISAIVEEAILAGVIGGITGGFAGGLRGGFAVYDDTKIQAKEMSDLRRVLGFKAAERATEGITEFSETARTIPAPPVPGEQQKPNAAKEAENGQQPVSAGTAEESQPQKENTAEAATPEEAGNVNNGAFYVKMAYDRAVNDLVSKCGMTQKAAETYIDRAMAQAADVVGNKIPQILEHELDDATLEGQADEIAAEFRKTVENLGKDRPLSAQFRAELDGIEQKAKEYAESQGIKGKRAELYGLLYRQQVSMWHSITGMSPEYIAERFPVVLQNYNSGAKNQVGKNQIDYSKDGKYYDSFIDTHKEYAAKDPGDWEGQTIEEAKAELDFDKNRGYAGIKSPIEEVKITDGGFTHLFKENNKERKHDLLRAKATIEEPDIIIEEQVTDKKGNTKPYHYYVKIFNRDGENKGHWQVVKVMPDGSWYSTNYPLKKKKFEKKIKNGTVIYDRAVQRTEPLPNKRTNQDSVYPDNDSALPSNSSIADKSSKNKSDNATSLYQTAYAGSRTDYDRPALEAIGTGEGNQVHGWGLYYALNRDVAEGYRERSYSKYKRTYIQSLDQEFNELRANGKPFLEVYDVDVSRDLMETLLHKPYGVIEKELENRINRWQDRLNNKEYQFKDYAKGKIEAYTKLKNDLHEYGTALIKQDTGQVHEVDIPENPYLLDEDLPINEQSEIVRRAVRSIMNDYPDNYDYSENYDAGSFGSLNGREFYKELMFIAQRNGTDDRTEQKKFASRTLEKYGIKGITYDGRRDGRCFVIFNPDDIKVIQKFYQDIAGAAQGGIDGSGPRGATTAWPGDPRLLIELFRSADDSTLPHELAHVFMLNLQRMRALDPDGRVGAMLNDLNEAVGEPAGEMPGTYSEAQQEKFARMFERYLAEGNAPNKKLKRIFVAFKEWLRDIYRTFKGWPELSPAAKRLFDKWLTFDDVANIPDTEALKEYGKKTAALKAVAEAAKESRDTEADGITVQDVKAVLNVTRMARPEEPEAAKAYNETLAIADSITESQAEAENILDSIEDMEYNGARQPDERDLALIDKAIADIQAIEDNPDIEIPGITDTEEGQPQEEAEEQPGSETADRPEAQTVQEEPKPRKVLPGTYVHKEEDGTYSINGTYYVASYYKSGRIKENRGWEDIEETGTIAEGFKTEEEARAFASRIAEMQEEIPGSGGAKAERAGLPRRPKHSQTGKDLLKMLGFKDVKTGRELTKGEEKALASAAYDGIYDLAEIMNIPPESLALNGTLTIKLGAPKTDIKPGEGAKYRAKDKTIIMEAEAGSGRFAAAWYAAFRDYMKSPEIRPEMAEAFRELEKAIYSRKRTAEEARKEYEAGLKEIKAAEKAAMDAIDSSDEAFALYGLADMVTSTDEYIDAYPEPFEDPVFEPEPRPYGVDNWIIDEATKKAGEKGARLINRLIEAHNWEVEYNKTDFGWEYSRFATDYSTAIGKTTEDTKEKDEPSEVMEEAAFASYIYNRLLERGGRNTFLTRPEGGKTFNVRRAVAERINTDAKQGEAGDPFAYPYPVGRERQAIFNAFDKVFSTLKYETTESGKVRLYQEGKEHIDYSKDGKYYENFLETHKNLIAEKPPKWEDITEQALKDEIMFNEEKGYAEVRTLLETIRISNDSFFHLFVQNDKNRKKLARRALLTVKEPNIVIECEEPNIHGRLTKFHYYIKLFHGKDNTGKDEVKPYMQLVKVLPGGNWYVTNYTIDKGKFEKRMKIGEIIYDLAARPTKFLPKEADQNGVYPNSGQTLPTNNSLTDKNGNVNTDSGQTLYQSAKNSLPETIDIDGEQKPTTNSEGRPIAATEEGVRNFYKWFGNSKVVDNDGRPLVVYHGGGNDIKIFDYSKIGQQGRSEGSGFEFTANKDLAQGYADRHGGGLYPVYLRIERPILDLDQTTLSDEQKYNFLELFNDKVNQDEEYVSEMGEDSVLSDYGSIDGALSAVQYDKDLDVVNEFINSTHRNKEILEAFAEVAYDGVILTNGSEWHSNGLYVVFNNNQIKSVDNTGKFDPGNPNIFYQPSKEPDRFRREDYAWAFRKTGDNRYAISKINSVIGSLMKELQKRKIDPETKERITRTLRSAIGYKGYLTRVRQARSLVDGAIRNASGLENTFTEMRPKPVLTEEKAAETIQVRYDPEKQVEIDRRAGAQTEWEEFKGNIKNTLTKVGRSVSDRAGKISPRLKLAFRDFARSFNMQRTAHVKAIEPFLKAYHAMEDNDKPIFDWAAFNGDTETIERLKKKYENLAPALETYRNVLNEIYVQAAEAGFEVGYIQDYFPRKVKNPEALITLIKKTDEWTYIERWLKQHLKVNDPDGWINAREHQEVIADMISRYLHTTGFGGQGGTGKPGNIKKRRIFEVTPEMMRYYYDSVEAAVMYAAEMDRAIQARKFFGYDLQHEEESISMVIADIIEDRKAAKAKDPNVKLLTQKEADELFRNIQSVMHPTGPNNAFQNIKAWGYMFTLVSPISTITQLEDLSVSFAENGIGRTLESATGKKITLEDIGVEIYDPDINSLTGINKYLNTALKATGFSKMDRFGKETFILSDFKKRAEQVRKDRKGFIEECEMYGYEAGRIKNMISAFEKGDANALNDDAKSLLFYDLAEVQPIDMAEMPEMYLRGGNWRIAYALKTFTLKRLNYLIEKSRRYAVQGRKLWDKGDKDAAMQEWIKGIKTMTWTMFLLVTAGASMDWLKDLIMGRQTDIPSVVVDNILKQASFNRWEVKRVAQEGFMDVIVAKTYPVMGVMLQDILTDLQRIYNGSLEMKDMRIWNNIPIVGRFYYWWFGGGKLLTEKQKEKEARKSRTGNRRRKERKDR